MTKQRIQQTHNQVQVDAVSGIVVVILKLVQPDNLSGIKLCYRV